MPLPSPSEIRDAYRRDGFVVVRGVFSAADVAVLAEAFVVTVVGGMGSLLGAVVAAVGIPVMYLLSGGVGVALLLYYRLVHGGRAIARRPSPA